jgi:adenosylmethionine---8-amino-7-oxononanoate aminotransferase
MSELIARDLAHVWHPCSQMKDFEHFPPLEISHASGSYLVTKQGNKIIDAISSWWCKSLGHAHPRIKSALISQLDKFEHAIGANITYDKIVELSENLAMLSPGLDKVFYASDGSCAVEIALKLALHGMQLKNKPQCRQFAALSGGYHGETLATLAISDLGLYKKPYENTSIDCHMITDIPYVNSKDSPLWSDASSHWQHVKNQLEPIKETLCAIVVEPILQGAGGMKLYSADFLEKLAQFAKSNDIYLIADEIMTGLGRTGKWFAFNHANIKPDMICLSKGLTSGTLPLSAVLIDDAIYDLFYDDYHLGKSFLHSHTYSGNALGVSVALETLNIMQEIGINTMADNLGTQMHELFSYVSEKTGKIKNIRQIGAMVAGDLIDPPKARMGYEVYKHAVSKGALLRPLANTLYWLPPINTKLHTLEELSTITIEAINIAYE